MSTPTPITDAGLAELERLEEAATPGPWKAKPMGGDSYVTAPTHRWHRALSQDYGHPIAVPRHLTAYPDGGERVDDAAGFAHDDAYFIAAARTALPSLVHRLRTAEVRLHKLAPMVEEAALCTGTEERDADGVVVAASLKENLAALVQDASERDHFNRAAFVDLGANPPILWKDRAEKAEAEVARLQAAASLLMKWFDGSGSSVRSRWQRVPPEEAAEIIHAMRAALIPPPAPRTAWPGQRPAGGGKGRG